MSFFLSKKIGDKNGVSKPSGIVELSITTSIPSIVSGSYFIFQNYSLPGGLDIRDFSNFIMTGFDFTGNFSASSTSSGRLRFTVQKLTGAPQNLYDTGTIPYSGVTVLNVSESNLNRSFNAIISGNILDAVDFIVNPQFGGFPTTGTLITNILLIP